LCRASQRAQSCQSEIEHLQAWSTDNNLKLNRGKTKKIVFSARRKVALPPPRTDFERVSSLRVLGVILNDKLTAADNVTALLSSGPACSMLYAMRVLRSHGTPTTSLQDIFCATVISCILYAAPSWSGMCSAADHARLDSLLRRSKRLGYCIRKCRSSHNCSILLTTTFSSASKLQ